MISYNTASLLFPIRDDVKKNIILYWEHMHVYWIEKRPYDVILTNVITKACKGCECDSQMSLDFCPNYSLNTPNDLLD